MIYQNLSCNLNYPDCYARRHKGNFHEMKLEEVKTMIDKLAKEKVFQIAIGGGDPLMRDDIINIAAYAHNADLIVHQF